jgi:DNA-directed RNA polymerase alpha subunit
MSSAAWSLFDEQLNIIEPPQNYLSFADLQNVVGFRSSLMTENTKEFERILFENGADISKPYNVVRCLHRPRTSNKPYDGFRVEFTERTDKEWRNTGVASLEAWVFSSKDKSLQQEMRNMSRERNNSVERNYDSRNFNNNK